MGTPLRTAAQRANILRFVACCGPFKQERHRTWYCATARCGQRGCSLNPWSYYLRGRQRASPRVRLASCESRTVISLSALRTVRTAHSQPVERRCAAIRLASEPPCLSFLRTSGTYQFPNPRRGQQSSGASCNLGGHQRGLTPRSSADPLRLPHLAASGASGIMPSAAKRVRLHGPLSSNVRHHMARDPLLNEIRCELSRRFAIAQTEIDLSRYRLKPMVSRYGGPQEAILSFEEPMLKGHANPEEEGEIVLSVLSLIFDCKVRKTGYRINALDISGSNDRKPHLAEHFGGAIQPGDYAAHIKNLFTLGDQLAKQFIRASNAYSLAIASVELDSSLSFLLLVTALECVSTQEEFLANSVLDKSKKSTERYCRLVQTYCDNAIELYPRGGEKDFIRDLKTVYYSHRSAFVHGGKEVSIASKIADQSGFNSIGHFVDGEEVFTPGLKWFFQITRRTLLGFLTRHPREGIEENPQVLADIASSRAVVTMRVGGA